MIDSELKPLIVQSDRTLLLDVHAARAEDAKPDENLIKERIDAIISEVNQRLLPYQRIERVTILGEPMEMTTTKKIKRDNV